MKIKPGNTKKQRYAVFEDALAFVRTLNLSGTVRYHTFFISRVHSIPSFWANLGGTVDASEARDRMNPYFEPMLSVLWVASVPRCAVVATRGRGRMNPISLKVTGF